MKGVLCVIIRKVFYDVLLYLKGCFKMCYYMKGVLCVIIWKVFYDVLLYESVFSYLALWIDHIL